MGVQASVDVREKRIIHCLFLQIIVGSKNVQFTDLFTFFSLLPLMERPNHMRPFTLGHASPLS